MNAEFINFFKKKTLKKLQIILEYRKSNQKRRTENVLKVSIRFNYNDTLIALFLHAADKFYM